MNRIIVFLKIILFIQYADAQPGFKNIFDFSSAGLAFSSMEYNNDNSISIYGNLITTDSKYGLLFASFDTSGNLLNYNVKFDSLGDIFTLVYPNSFIRLNDESGYAGIGGFFFRPFTYLILFNNDGTIKKLVEYTDPATLIDFYYEIIEVSDGFFILGEKQLNDYHTHLFLMKTDKEGNKLWEKLYGHPTRENGYGGIIKKNANEYVIGGTTTTIPTSPQLVYNTSNFYVIDSLGNLLSSWQSQPSATDMGVGGDPYPTEDGGFIYATTELQFGPPLNIYERKLKIIERDSAYNLVNEKTYGGFNSANNFRNFKKLANGDFLLLGQRAFGYSPSNSQLGSILRINENADSLWNYLDTAFTYAENPICDAVELSSGSIIACGYSRMFQPLVKDWAWVVKVSKDGCVDTLNCFPVSGIEPVRPSKRLKTYPNPVTDVLSIDFPSDGEKTMYCVYDLAGRLVMTGRLTSSTIAVGALTPGSYIVKVQNGHGQAVTKIIKT